MQRYFALLIAFSGSDYPGGARVTLRDDRNPGTLHDWARENTPISSGGSILTGVPEASEVLVVMCGLTGLLLGARRRRQTCPAA